jgi:hypothetical protein
MRVFGVFCCLPSFSANQPSRYSEGFFYVLLPKNCQTLIFPNSFVPFIILELFNKKSVDKNENKKFPYKLAKLVQAKKTYIEFWIWNNETKILQRKRYFKNPTLEKVAIINKELKEGYHKLSIFDKTIKEREQKKQSETAINAFQIALKNSFPRLRQKSKERYTSHINIFLKFLKENYKEVSVRSLQQSHIIEFLNFIQEKNKIVNRTRNAYGSTIRIMLNDLKEIDYVDTNVMENFKNLKESKTTAHKFYTEIQLIGAE